MLREESFARVGRHGPIVKVVELGSSVAKVEFFRTPDSRSVEEVATRALQPWAIRRHTRCFVQAVDGQWLAGRVTDVLEESVEVFSWRGREYYSPEQLHFSCSPSGDDLPQILSLFGHDKPSLHVLRRGFVRSLQKQESACRGLNALFSARVQHYPHQVQVIQRVLEDPILRFVLADEVGLGKTIEAGIIAKQYLLDYPGRRLLVLVPTALEGQWQEELEFKVGLSPIGFVVQTFDEFFSDGYVGRPGLVIVDEAHQLVSATWQGDPQARNRFNALRSLCVTAEAVLLLTATPVSNHEREFLAMLHLISPDQYQLEDEAIFRDKMAIRQTVGRLLLALEDDADAYELRLIAHSISEALPEDAVAQDYAELLRKATTATSDNTAMRGQIRRTRAYLNESYRLSRRLIRTRRESITKGDIRQRPEIIRLTRVINDPPESIELLDLLETWREWSHSKAVADPRAAEVYHTIFRLLWSAYSCSISLLEAIIRTRLGSQVDRALGMELNRSDLAALKAVPKDPEEGEILQALLRHAVESGIDKHRARAISQYCEQHSSARGVIFVSSPWACIQIANDLKCALGDTVECLHVGLDSSHADNNVDRFLTDPTVRVLVCDRTGEEGRNFQLAGFAICVDLPFNPFRIEQRCGRFDRIGQTHSVDFATLAGPEHASSLPQAWMRLLNEGFRVFSEPISSLQFYSDQATTHLLARAYSHGALGVIDAIPDIRSQLDSEKQRIREQDILEAMESDDRSHQIVASMAALEAQPQDLCNAMDPWIRYGLKFQSAPASETLRVGYKPSPATRVSENCISVVGARYDGTYTRTVDGTEFAPPLLRVGDLFIDRLARDSEQDDVGRTFAFWRHYPNQDAEFGGDWSGFRFELRIEPDVEAMIKVAADHCRPINEAAFRRRALSCFAPTMRYLFLDTGLQKVAPQSDQFRVLDSPYRSTKKGGTDTSLIGSLGPVFDALGLHDDWPSLCKRASIEAKNQLLSMQRLQAELRAGAEIATAYVERVTEQLRCHGDKEGMIYEASLGSALIQGIRQAKVNFDSMGFIAVSSRPIVDRI